MSEKPCDCSEIPVENYTDFDFTETEEIVCWRVMECPKCGQRWNEYIE